MTENIKSASFNSRDLFYMLFKHKGIIIFIFLLTIVFVILGSYMIPLQYKALALIYIKRNIQPIPIQSQMYFTHALESHSVLTSEMELLKSTAVIGPAVDDLLSRRADTQNEKEETREWKVVKYLKLITQWLQQKKHDLMLALGLVATTSEREQVIDYFQKQIKVRPKSTSDVLEVSLDNKSPEAAAEIINTVIRFYLRYHLDMIKRPGNYEFFDNQAQLNGNILEDLEKKIQSFKEERSIFSIEDQKKMKIDELSSLETMLNEVKSQKIELGERVTSLRRYMQGQPEKIVSSKAIRRNPHIERIQAKILDFEAQKSNLLQMHHPQSKKVADIESVIADMRIMLSKEPASVVETETITANTIRQRLEETLLVTESELKAKYAREAVLLKQKEEVEEKLQKLNQYGDEMKALTLTVDKVQKSHARYVDQREDARIADAADTATDARVMQWASVPAAPIYSRFFFWQLGALSGALAGIALALVLEMFDRSLCNKEQVERELNLPVIASIPEARFYKNQLVRRI